jgi:alpha-beta hydrolase superfamily lysophospholipase
MTDRQNSPNTIVLIHGLWVTPLSWEHRIERYSAKGYQVLAPAWPRMDRPIEELRTNPDLVAELGIEEIVDHYAEIIGALDAPPIIMGHSFGGAFTEVLLDRGFGAAGVAIDAAAVTDRIYDRYAVPGPGRVLFQGALANFNPNAPTKIDWHNEARAPLLLIAGGADHTVPAVVDRATPPRYRNKSDAITEYMEFEGRSHFTLGQEGSA